MEKVSRVKQRAQTHKKRRMRIMRIRRKAVNDVNKESIDTSVSMDKMIDFQNDDITPLLLLHQNQHSFTN